MVVGKARERERGPSVVDVEEKLWVMVRVTVRFQPSSLDRVLVLVLVLWFWFWLRIWTWLWLGLGFYGYG